MIDDEHLAGRLELEAGALAFALSHPELAGMTLSDPQERFAQSPRLTQIVATAKASVGNPDYLKARNRVHVMRLKAADDPEMLRLSQLVDEDAARGRTASVRKALALPPA
jgi:hypothetical protein